VSHKKRERENGEHVEGTYAKVLESSINPGVHSHQIIIYYSNVAHIFIVHTWTRGNYASLSIERGSSYKGIGHHDLLTTFPQPLPNIV
jgi:hypothetical protein